LLNAQLALLDTTALKLELSSRPDFATQATTVQQVKLTLNHQLIFALKEDIVK